MRDALAILLFLAAFSVFGLYWGIAASGWPTDVSSMFWALGFGMTIGGAVLMPFLFAMQKDQPAEMI